MEGLDLACVSKKMGEMILLQYQKNEDKSHNLIEG